MLVNEKMPQRNIAVLISGSGSNLQAIIDACKTGKLGNTKICLVISNKADAYGLERAKKANIETKVISHKNYSDRQKFDEELHSSLIVAKADVVCLAGFMRLLTADFVNKWQGRMINIHPSLLPAFKGANAIKDAYEYGVKITGCTVHYVVPEMDSGPIICQKAVVIEPNDSQESLAQKIHQQEHIAYIEALQSVLI